MKIDSSRKISNTSNIWESIFMFGIINHFKNRIAFLTHNISQMYYYLKEEKKTFSWKKIFWEKYYNMRGKTSHSNLIKLSNVTISGITILGIYSTRYIFFLCYVFKKVIWYQSSHILSFWYFVFVSFIHNNTTSRNFVRV